MRFAGKNESTLAARLGAYSAAAKTLNGRCARTACAAAAGSALAMTTGATASIIYSGLQHLVISVTEPGGLYNHSAHETIDIDGVALDLKVENHQFTYSGAYYHTAQAHFAVPTTGLSLAKTHTSANALDLLRFAPHAVISSGAAAVWNRSGYAKDQFHDAGSTSGAGPAGAQGVFPIGHTANAASGTGIAAFRVYQGAPGRFDFGWIRIGIDDTNSNSWLDTVTAIDWAYQSVVNTPIAAGDTGVASIPEPGTRALMLLALGSAGVLAWKKRRKAAG